MVSGRISAPMRRVDEQMAFVAEVGKLKSVLRQTVLAGIGRPENSAEHSWHLAMMVLALAEHAPAGTDIARVIDMVLVHDIVEIDVGDLFAYAEPSAIERQEAAERAAATRIFAILPGEQGTAMRQLWAEFTERHTTEAKFARAIDRLQPMLENVAVGGGTWQRHGITADQVLAKVELIEDGSATLGRYARDLVERAVATGILAPGSGLAHGSGKEDQLDG